MVLLSITLITLDLRGNAVVDGARRVATTVLSPVRSLGHTVFHPVTTAWHGAFDYNRVKKRNAELQERVDAMEGASIVAEAQIRELNALKAEDGLTPLNNFTRVFAEVVGQPANNFQLTMEINRGSDQGISTGYPVLNTAGLLVGRVGQVYPSYSVVRLITDPNVNVAIKVLGTKKLDPLTTTTTAAPPAVDTTVAPAVVPTGDPAAADPAVSTAPTTTAVPTTTTTVAPVLLDSGFIHGLGASRDLVVELVNRASNVQVGDPVVTSGVDDSLFPGDIPIGRVTAVRSKAGSTDLEIVVRPIAQLDDIQYVRVLLYDPGRRPVKG